MIKLSHYIARFIMGSNRTRAQACGMVELALISLSHAVFCLFLLWFFSLNIFEIFDFSLGVHQLVVGFFLGIGLAGASFALCQFIMVFIENISYINAPKSLGQWIALSKGGWISHHLHSFSGWPVLVSVTILFFQVGSEEIIFRGIVPVLLSSDIPQLGQFLSLILFMLMQCFLMNSFYSMLFPLVGSLIMGCIHSYCYLYWPFVWPLIVSHVTFFIFSTL